MSMNTNDVAKLVTAFAAGDLAYEGLVEQIGETAAGKVVALVASVGAGGIAAKLADGSIDLAREVPIVGNVIDVADDVIGGVSDAASDVLDSINPFKW
jgi:hypothetical protein